jgi:hypothetical protein
MTIMRKYESYNLVADFGMVNNDHESYMEAHRAYCKEGRNGNAATLYGRTFDGDICVIKSRG